jgi:hypothetical protein
MQTSFWSNIYWTADREVAGLQTGNCLSSQITLTTQAANMWPHCSAMTYDKTK